MSTWTAYVERQFTLRGIPYSHHAGTDESSCFGLQNPPAGLSIVSAEIQFLPERGHAKLFIAELATLSRDTGAQATLELVSFTSRYLSKREHACYQLCGDNAHQNLLCTNNDLVALLHLIQSPESGIKMDESLRTNIVDKVFPAQERIEYLFRQIDLFAELHRKN